MSHFFNILNLISILSNANITNYYKIIYKRNYYKHINITNYYNFDTQKYSRGLLCLKEDRLSTWTIQIKIHCKNYHTALAIPTKKVKREIF